MIKLENGPLAVEIDPDRGAEITSFKFTSRSDGDIFAPSTSAERGSMFGGVQVLIPWVNRISGDGFSFDDQFHPLTLNLKDNEFPIHGNGFQCPWDVRECDGKTATLFLRSDGPGPFVYEAEYRLKLESDCLTISLDFKNCADIRLPFSLGFHPWMPRTQATTLRARCSVVWFEDEKYLPTYCEKISDDSPWNFNQGRDLPSNWVNNAFTGWDGTAEIQWPERNLSLLIEAEGLDCLHLYSPNADADFFCVEPISSIPDAVNHLAQEQVGSAIVLEPGQTVSASCKFSPSALADPT